MSISPNILAGVIGHWQLIIILVIALLIFGKRLPDIAKSVGKSLTAFKKGLNEIEDDIENSGKDDHVKKVDAQQKDDTQPAAENNPENEDNQKQA